MVPASPGTAIKKTNPSRVTRNLVVGVGTVSALAAGEAEAESRGVFMAIPETKPWKSPCGTTRNNFDLKYYKV